MRAPAAGLLPLMAMLALLAAAPAAAQRIPWRTAAWNDAFVAFDTLRYVAGDDARHDSAAGIVRLTPSVAGTAGRLFLRAPLDLDAFDARFDLWLGTRSQANNWGADGIVFALARVIDYPVAYGGKLNFDGCLGFGVEFDTYENSDENDPSEHHVAGLAGTADQHRSPVTLPSADLEDGRWHTYTVRNRRGAVAVFSGGAPLLSFAIDSGFTGYAGFTSSTGYAFNEHAVDNVFLSVPARASASFGVVSTCEGATPIVRDTAAIIVNNHPEGALSVVALTITELDGNGEFSFPAPPALPRALAAGDSLTIAVRFSGAGAGSRRAVLRVAAENGEAVLDTIRIALEEPRARWSAAGVVFPRTHAGAARDTTVALVNSSRVAVRIEGLAISPAAFRVVAPAAWPVDLPAGDTLAVTIRFAPAAAGPWSGTLAVERSCGDFRPLALAGEAYSSTVTVGFPWPPLMLRPGEVDTLFVALLSDPAGAAITSFRGGIGFDPAVAVFLTAEPASDAPQGTTVAATPLAAGRLALALHAPQPLAAAGPLIALRFLAATAERRCTEVAWDSAQWNSEGPLPGVPAAGTVNGRICVNPSCRVPEGLLSTAAAPQLLVAPLPARDRATVTVVLPADASATLALAGSTGAVLQRLHRGALAAGAHAFTVDLSTLPSGGYFVLLETGGALRTAPLLVLR